MLECRHFASAADFLEFAEEPLLAHETEHNLVLGLASNVVLSGVSPEKALFLSVCDGNDPVGHAASADRDRPLAISRMGSEAVRVMIHFILDRGVAIPGVVGPIEASECFAREWEANAHQQIHLVMHQGVYQLDNVKLPAPDGGEMVSIAGIGDETILQYILGFIRDAIPEERNPEGTAQVALKRLRQNGSLFFWKLTGGLPVCMAAKARESRNGATISLVYTPPEFRRRGYASRLVAALTLAQLRQGKKFCNLFTDLKNPTSNSIYREIGYKKVGESKHFEFR
jgi:ribosomal protein S18 acetylase RimI-like enzyme